MYLTMHLFGNPGQEIPSGSELTETNLREARDLLYKRLTVASEYIRRLRKAGFKIEMGQYDFHAYGPDVPGTDRTIRRHLATLLNTPIQNIVQEMDAQGNPVYEIYYILKGVSV